VDLRCDELTSHVRLATRFVDWFSARGAAYEHNFNVVERQLGSLAQAAAPPVAGTRAEEQRAAGHGPVEEPYSDRLRF
jgi:hypothetical protein